MGGELERHGHRAAVPFGSLIYEPGNNIWAWPGDTIYLYKEPQTYLSFRRLGLAGPVPIQFRGCIIRLAHDVCRGGSGGGRIAGPPSRSRVGVPISTRGARTRRRCSASTARKWTVRQYRLSIR